MGDILFIAHRFPWPPDRGDRIRSRHLLRALTRLGTVHVAAFVDDEQDLHLVDRLPDDIGRCHVEIRTRAKRAAGALALASGRAVSVTAFESRTMHNAIDRLLDEEPIDTIFVYSGQMAQYVPADLGGRRFIMDFVDVDSAKFAAYAKGATGAMAAIHRREATLLARFEAAVAARAHASLFVTEAEAGLFRTQTGLGPDRVRALENGIDLDHFRPGAGGSLAGPPRPLIVFTGQMDYPPNVDAVGRFAREALPRIRAVHSDAAFAIVGRSPDSRVRALETLPGVIITGAVPDVRPWLTAADVVVAPLDMARGVQNKVLEAMAMGRPVVASPAAYEGIVAIPGEDLLVSQDSAKGVLGLLANPVGAEAIGNAARRTTEGRYGWAARLACLPALLGRDTQALAAE